jgi:predicted RNase H-like HicB family nuclease
VARPGRNRPARPGGAHRGRRADHGKGLDEALTRAAKAVKRTVEATTDEITSELQEALKG